jgi:hypothetical protein
MTLRAAYISDVGARYIVPAVPVRSQNCLSRHKCPPTVSLTPLFATVTASLVSVANKGLTQHLSPLDATLTKFQGGVN